MTNERRSTYSLPKIYKEDVREALFAQSMAKPKGLHGIRLKPLRILMLWCESNIKTIIQGHMRIGYRLHARKMAMDILLRKQSKLSDPIAKARLATALLSCVGEVIKIGHDSDRISM
jgi:hypothetical protein